MIKVFFVICILMSAGLAIGIIKINKEKKAITRPIQFLFAAAIVTILSEVVAVKAHHELIATLAHGLYFAFTDWLVIALLLYVRKYTVVFQERRMIRYIIILGAVIDTISMVVNAFWNHAFHVEYVQVYKDEYCYVIGHKYPAYTGHLIFVYVIVLFVLLTLIMKIRRSLRLYRTKYFMILDSLICILAVNIGYRFTNISIDISVVLYGFLAIAACYFSLFYVPKMVVERLMMSVLKEMDSGIMCFDLDGRCVYANEMTQHYFAAKDNYGKLERYFEEWQQKRIHKEPEDEIWQEIREDGAARYHYELQFKRLLDSNQNYIGCYFLINDRTAAVNALKHEHYRATHDELTGVYNRLGFMEKVAEVLEKKPDEQYYILYSDIKNFKLVNDLFGVQKGDEILLKTAKIIKEMASEDTIYGRLSADRFAMFIKKSNFHEETFIQAVDTLTAMAQNSVYRMHMHIGVYEVTDPDMEVSVMCDRAHLAIQKVKDDYQKIIVYYDEILGDELHREIKMLGEFECAIEEEQFQIYLQPQISVTGRLLGAEALVRWFHPERGMVPPGEFISAFERAGFIHRLDRYVWELACKQLRQWKEQGREDLHISVNISPKDFYYIDIYETFTELVEQYQINPASLKLEITETAIMTKLQQQLSLLGRLREYGFSVEIDDFGSGYSSLNTLKDMDVDVLKLDMGFLGETLHSDRSKTIMNMVIAMSKQLGLIVITEGVETKEQVEYLTDAGCDVFQGYYFAKPMCVKEFEEKYML